MSGGSGNALLFNGGPKSSIDSFLLDDAAFAIAPVRCHAAEAVDAGDVTDWFTFCDA